MQEERPPQCDNNALAHQTVVLASSLIQVQISKSYVLSNKCYYIIYYNALCILCQSSLYQERKMHMSKKLKAHLMHGTYNYVYTLPVLVIIGIKDFPL